LRKITDLFIPGIYTKPIPLFHGEMPHLTQVMRHRLFNDTVTEFQVGGGDHHHLIMRAADGRYDISGFPFAGMDNKLAAAYRQKVQRQLTLAVPFGFFFHGWLAFAFGLIRCVSVKIQTPGTAGFLDGIPGGLKDQTGKVVRAQ